MRGEVRDPLRSCAAAVLGLTAVAVPLLLSAVHPQVKLLALAAGGCLAVSLVAPAWIIGREGRPLPRLLGPAAAFLLASLPSIAGAIRPGEGLRALYVWGLLFGLYAVTASVLEALRAARRLAGAMVAVGCVVAVVSAVQFFDPSSFAAWHAGGQAIGTLGNPNYVGGYLAGLSLVCQAFWWDARTPFRRGLSAVALGVLVLGLVVAMARGAWLGFLAGMLLFGAWMAIGRAPEAGRAWSRAGALVGLFGVLGMVGLWIRGRGFLAYAVTALDPSYPSNAARLIWWRGTLALAADHPLLGVGLGNFQMAFTPYNATLHERANQLLMVEHPHNELLGLAAEGGLLSLFAFGWLLWRCGILAGQALRARRRSQPFVAGLVAMLAAALVHSLFFFALREPAGAMNLWIAVGLLEVVTRVPADPARAETRPAGALAASVFGAAAILAGAVGYFLAVRPAIAASSVQAGKLALAASQPGVAEAHLRRALAWDPGSADAAFQLGTTLAAQGRRAEAERAFARAAQANPGFLSAANNRAVILADLGKRDEAMATLREALARNPRYASGQNNLGRLLFDQRRDLQAIPHLERATAAFPAFAMARRNLAIAYARVGRLGDAERQLLATLDLVPRDAAVWVDLAVLRSAAGQAEGALEALRRAVEIDPRLRGAVRDDPRFLRFAQEPGFAALVRADGSVSR